MKEERIPKFFFNREMKEKRIRLRLESQWEQQGRKDGRHCEGRKPEENRFSGQINRFTCRYSIKFLRNVGSYNPGRPLNVSATNERV